MNPDQGTELRSGRIISSSLETPVPTDPDMAQSSANDSDSNETSDISSQLSEIRESYERKINELQNEFSQLKDLMMAVISKTDSENRPSTSKGPSKPAHTVGLDMVTGVTETRSTCPTSSFTNFRRYQEDDSDEEGESTPRSNEERLLNAIETIPQRIKSTTTNTKLLQTHVPNFRGQKDKFVEFEHLLLNHLSPLANKITEENKLHFFQSLLRDDAIEYWQSIQITPLTTLKDVLDLFRKEFAKEDLKEVARYKWDQARYDPTTETFSDFLKNLKKIAKQAFGEEADKIIKMFLFGKLPVEIQQELTMANKEESSPEEIKTYLMRKYQYQQYVAPPTTIQPFNTVTSSVPMTNTTIKPATMTTTQPTERKRFEGQCFYCGKTGHRKTECRARQRDEANGIKKEDAIPMRKATDPDKPKYNPKLVCQICGYTCHSARDCRRRVPKESSSAYGKIPYTTNSQDDNKARRQDLKRQQKPMNPMQAITEDDEQLSYSDEDINQGF